jgi:hypothetical protein
VKAWTRSWSWGAALLVLVILALGPHLQVLGKDTGFPLPYALLDRVPFIGASRQPLRFLATAGICLSLLAAYGTAWLLAAAEGRSWQRALVPALLALVALELFGVPRALLNTDVDPAYAFIRDQPEDGAVMELPYERWQAPAMLNQSIHERPILGGYTSRHFPYQFVEGAPGVAQLAVGFPPTLAESDILSPSLELTALPSLDYYGVRYAVMHKADIASGRYGRLQTLLKKLYPDGPVYEDDEVLVYRTPVGPGNSGGPTDALPLVGLGSGWHELEENPTRRWAGSNPDDGNADIWLGVRPTAEGRHTLGMDLFSYGRPRTLTVQVNGKDVGTAQVDLAPRTFEFDLGDLREGNYNIRLLVDEPPESPPGDRRKLSIGSTRVEVRRAQP